MAENTDANLRERLREATAALHASVETRLDLDAAIVTPSDYAALLARFFGFYAPVERGLSQLDWRGSGFDFSKRLKVGWIKADLADFGIDDEAAAALPEIAECSTAGDDLGRPRRSSMFSKAPPSEAKLFYGALDQGLAFTHALADGSSPVTAPMSGACGGNICLFSAPSGERIATAAVIERAAIRTFQAFNVWLSPSMADAPGDKWTRGSWHRLGGGEAPHE